MKYYYLTSRDRRTNDFVFYKYRERSGLCLRPEQAELVCPVCRKLDQAEALRRKLTQGDINTKDDWIHALDGPLCVSLRARKALEVAGAKGLRFDALDLLDGRMFWIVSSSIIVPTKMPEYMRVGPLCEGCGRHRFILGFPKRQYYEFPDDELVVFEGTIPKETESNLQTWLIASKTIVDRLRAAKLKGFRCFEVEP